MGKAVFSIVSVGDMPWVLFPTNVQSHLALGNIWIQVNVLGATVCCYQLPQLSCGIRTSGRALKLNHSSIQLPGPVNLWQFRFSVLGQCSGSCFLCHTSGSLDRIPKCWLYPLPGDSRAPQSPPAHLNGDAQGTCLSCDLCSLEPPVSTPNSCSSLRDQPHDEILFIPKKE